MIDYKKLMRNYNSYLETDEAEIVFLTKSVFSEIDTKAKWIDVLAHGDLINRYNHYGEENEQEVTAFTFAIIELFPRKIRPHYPKDASTRMKRAITWNAAHADIRNQRKEGIRGTMLLLSCSLYDKNRDKLQTVYYPDWNEEYGGFDHTGNAPTITIAKKERMKPEWVYRSIDFRRIKENEREFIDKNMAVIEQIIDKKRAENKAWFFSELIEPKVTKVNEDKKQGNNQIKNDKNKPKRNSNQKQGKAPNKTSNQKKKKQKNNKI